MARSIATAIPSMFGISGEPVGLRYFADPKIDFAAMALAEVEKRLASLPKPSAQRRAAAASKTDPVFAAIAAHREQSRRVDVMTSDMPKFGEEYHQEAVLWNALCRTEPTTIEGLCAFVNYISSDPALALMCADDGPAQALTAAAASAAKLTSAPVPPQYRWREPPPLEECGLGDAEKAA